MNRDPIYYDVRPRRRTGVCADPNCDRPVSSDSRFCPEHAQRLARVTEALNLEHERRFQVSGRHARRSAETNLAELDSIA